MLLLLLIALGLVISLAVRYWANASAGEAVLAPPSATHGAVDIRLSEDTPHAYHQAQVLCERVGDRVCQAEAALLSDLRYGPDGVQRSLARTLLRELGDGGFAGAPGVRRVRGLLALCHGDVARAASLLKDDDPRSQLYRGWVAAARGDDEGARLAAEAVLAASPGDAAAGLLAIDSDPEATLDDYRRLAELHPAHPRIEEALIHALIDEGELLEAELRIQALEPHPRASPSYRAGAILFAGRVAEVRGFPSAALERYDEARDQAPQRQDVLLRRSRLLLDTGDHARLRGELEHGLVGASPALVGLGVELELRSGRLRAAERFVDDLAARGLGTPWVPYLRALIERERGDASAALGEVAAARELDPDFVPAVAAQASILLDLGRGKEAYELLRAARDGAVERRARRSLVAAEIDALLAESRRREALIALDQALADDPTDNAARIRRGALRWELGRIDAARDDLLRVEARAGILGALIGPLGRLYLAEGAVERAASLVQPRLEDRRADADVVLLAAEIAFRDGDLPRAEALVRRHLLRQSEDAWRGALLEAKIREAKGDYHEASAAIAAVHPPRPIAEVELVAGRIHEAKGELDKALARYRRAHHYNPHSPEIGLRVAWALTRSGDAAGALKVLAPMVDGGRGPDGVHALLAEAYIRAGDPRRALEVVDARLEAEPTDAATRYWRGRLLDDRRRRAAALEAYELAIAGAEGDPPWLDDALERLVAGYEAQGDSSRAGLYRARLEARKAID
jgi:tetratricopeptide (TPR) repeat protein